MGQQQPVENQLNPNYSTQFPLPPGEFDPRAVVPNPANPQAQQQGGVPANQQMTDVTAWAHDATVQPGKTYRYKVRYKIKNPIWRTVNIADNKNLSQDYYIASADSDWTSEVHVPQLTTFFIASLNPNGTARMDVFRY